MGIYIPSTHSKMRDVSQDKTVSMFFNEEFNPENYVDALHLSIAGNSDRYSTQTLGSLNTKTQELLTHLDYNTNVLLHELEKKMEQLKRALEPIGISEFALAEESLGTASSESSRLQYYVDSLKNAVEMLSLDVETVRLNSKQPDINVSLNKDLKNPVDSLILLKQVKANILEVYHVIQNAQRKVSRLSELTLSDEEFLATLLLLHESLRNKLRDGSEEERAEISKTVKELRLWVPMFQPFTRFGPAYVKFVIKMESEL